MFAAHVMGVGFGRYELLKKIASGGMGQVLLARKGAKGFEKLVVLKRILPHLVEDEEFFAMFQDEARITMRLDHPNIARINEFGEEAGVHFIEMEYVAGTDVRRLDKRAAELDTYLPVGLALRVVADAAAGLDYAHKAKDASGAPLNLVHRDVSPQNVLVGFDGSVKLIDFGVAKAAGRLQHTATGVLKGKFPYMSPEQAEGHELDARSDVFALGVVLWEMLTGKRLFKGDNDLASQRLVLACQVPAPSSVNRALPAGLDSVVLKALARDVSARYADAAAFRSALEAFAQQSALPSSNQALSEFMHQLFAERIAQESDPSALEADASVADFDLVTSGRPNSASRASRSATPAKPVTKRSSAKSSVTKAAPAPPKRDLATLLLVGGLAVLALIVAAIAVVWVRRSPEPVNRPLPLAVVTPSVPDAAVGATLTLATVTWVQVRVESTPPGAEVTLGGEKKGLTPLDLKLDAATLPRLLEIARDGYESYQVTLTDTSGPTLAAVLRKRPVKAPAGGKKPVIKTVR